MISSHFPLNNHNLNEQKKNLKLLIDNQAQQRQKSINTFSFLIYTKHIKKLNYIKSEKLFYNQNRIKFIENKVYGPNQFWKPYLLFTTPSFDSARKAVEIQQILLDGTGQRLQKVLRWQLEQMNNEDAYANIYVFDCHIALQNMKNQFNIQFDVINYNNKSHIYISQNEEINQIYETLLNEAILPKQQPLQFVATAASRIIKEQFLLQSKEIDVQFLYPDRFIGQDNIIKARGYDKNIKDEN